MNLQIVPFYIELQFDSKTYKLYVTHEVFESVEIFTVAAKNKTIQVQSNRPLLRHNTLNKKKIKWSVINGQLGYQTFLEKIIAELESKIKSIEKPPFNWDEHPKNNPY